MKGCFYGVEISIFNGPLGKLFKEAKNHVNSNKLDIYSSTLRGTEIKRIEHTIGTNVNFTHIYVRSLIKSKSLCILLYA